MTTEAIKSVSTDIGPLGKWIDFVAALVGPWIAASQFVLTGAIDRGTVMHATVAAGLLAVGLAGYTGDFLYADE